MAEMGGAGRRLVELESGERVRFEQQFVVELKRVCQAVFQIGDQSLYIVSISR